MIFLVEFQTPILGRYTAGYLETGDRKSAQQTVVDILIEAGFPKEKIGIQVTDNTYIEIGNHRVSIIPIREFDSRKASGLAALLE